MRLLKAEKSTPDAETPIKRPLSRENNFPVARAW
jgi:hypothetical protein